MKNRSALKFLMALVLALTLAAAVPPARGQPQTPPDQEQGLGLNAGDESKPKEVPKAPIARRADSSPPLLWNFLIFVIILGLVFGANMIPSKRGHQD